LAQLDQSIKSSPIIKLFIDCSGLLLIKERLKEEKEDLKSYSIIMRKGSGKEKLKKPLPYLNQITAFGTPRHTIRKFTQIPKSKGQFESTKYTKFSIPLEKEEGVNIYINLLI
jgi:hypothetical protein